MFAGISLLEPSEFLISRADPKSSQIPEAILAFSGTLLWVFLAFTALVVFREPIAKFLSTVGGRISKVGGIELELATAPKAELPNEARSFGSMDPQDLASSSGSMTLIQALSGPVVPDSYVVIDLGIGKSWLVSRLFIFAIMLRLVRGVRCFVFVHRGGRGRNEYLGTISTEDVQAALAQRYPWLERVYVKSYKDRLWPQYAPAQGPRGLDRRLDVSFCASAVQEYISLLKQSRNWTAAPAQHNDPELERNYPQFEKELAKENKWVDVGPTKEYGEWISEDLFESIFKGVIHGDFIPLVSSASDKVREIVNSKAPYVAIVRASGQFDALVDRSNVLEDLARRRIDEA